MRERGEQPEHFHTTRMVPKRAAELLDGGSLYWVIKGQVAARQTLLDIRPSPTPTASHRCQLVLDPQVVPVMPRPYRAFQGWRYLAAHEAPPDFGVERGGDRRHAGDDAARIARTRPALLSSFRPERRLALRGRRTI